MQGLLHIHSTDTLHHPEYSHQGDRPVTQQGDTPFVSRVRQKVRHITNRQLAKCSRIVCSLHTENSGNLSEIFLGSLSDQVF